MIQKLQKEFSHINSGNIVNANNNTAHLFGQQPRNEDKHGFNLPKEILTHLNKNNQMNQQIPSSRKNTEYKVRKNLRDRQLGAQSTRVSMELFSPQKPNLFNQKPSQNKQSMDISGGRSELYNASRLHKHTLYNDMNDNDYNSWEVNALTKINISSNQSKKNIYTNSNLFNKKNTKLFQTKNSRRQLNQGSSQFVTGQSSQGSVQNMKNLNYSLKRLHLEGAESHRQSKDVHQIVQFDLLNKINQEVVPFEYRERLSTKYFSIADSLQNSRHNVQMTRNHEHIESLESEVNSHNVMPNIDNLRVSQSKHNRNQSQENLVTISSNNQDNQGKLVQSHRTSITNCSNGLISGYQNQEISNRIQNLANRTKPNQHCSSVEFNLDKLNNHFSPETRNFSKQSTNKTSSLLSLQKRQLPELKMPQINFGQPVNNNNHIMNIKNEDYQYQSNMSDRKSRRRDKIMVSLPLQMPPESLLVNKAPSGEFDPKGQTPLNLNSLRRQLNSSPKNMNPNKNKRKIPQVDSKRSIERALEQPTFRQLNIQKGSAFQFRFINGPTGISQNLNLESQNYFSNQNKLSAYGSAEELNMNFSPSSKQIIHSVPQLSQSTYQGNSSRQNHQNNLQLLKYQKDAILSMGKEEFQRFHQETASNQKLQPIQMSSQKLKGRAPYTAFKQFSNKLMDEKIVHNSQRQNVDLNINQNNSQYISLEILNNKIIEEQVETLEKGIGTDSNIHKYEEYEAVVTQNSQVSNNEVLGVINRPTIFVTERTERTADKTKGIRQKSKKTFKLIQSPQKQQKKNQKQFNLSRMSKWTQNSGETESNDQADYTYLGENETEGSLKGTLQATLHPRDLS